MDKRILLVEDELPILEMVAFILQQAGYSVVKAIDYDQAVSLLKEPFPDLIILDWMLPGGSGLELLKQLQQHDVLRAVPVIMLTAKGAEEDKVQGLDAGADDYITKPFSPKELLARIKAIFRRFTPVKIDSLIEIAGLSLNPESHRVSGHGEALELGPTEFKLLNFFMTHTERVYSREQLLDNVWGCDVYIEDRTVDVHIRRLRKVLAKTDHANLIQTVRGSGYRFSNR